MLPKADNNRVRSVKPKTSDFLVGVSIDQHILVVFFWVELKGGALMELWKI